MEGKIHYLTISRHFFIYGMHEDYFELPEEATLLASGTDCVNQAFRSKDNIYGFQFHQK